MNRVPLNGMNKKQLRAILESDTTVYFDLVEHVGNVKAVERNYFDAENPIIEHCLCSHHFTNNKSESEPIQDDFVISIRITDGIIDQDNLKALIETGLTQIRLFKTKYLKAEYHLSFESPRTITLNHAYILKSGKENNKSRRFGDADDFWTELAQQVLDDFPDECRNKNGKPIKSQIALLIWDHWAGKYWSFYNTTDYYLGDFESRLKKGEQVLREQPPIKQKKIIERIKKSDLI